MRSLEKDVYITGIGVQSHWGNDPHMFWDKTTEITSDVTNIDYYKILRVIAKGKARFSDIKKNKGILERIVILGKDSLKSCIDDWGNRQEGQKVALLVGSGLGLSDTPNMQTLDEKILSSLGQEIAESVQYPFDKVIYIGNACCAGSQAIAYGMQLLMHNCYDVVIAGGIDAFSADASAGFMRLHAIDYEGCKPFDHYRKGISIGEGACFFALERKKSLLHNYGILKASNTTNDAFHVVQMNPNGKQIKSAILGVLARAACEPKDVDLIVAHGTGTIVNDKVEANVIKDIFNGYDYRVTSIKGKIGHTGGGSGAFGLLTAIGAMNTGMIPAIVNLKERDPDCEILTVKGKSERREVSIALINAFAFGGTNVCLLLQKI